MSIPPPKQHNILLLGDSCRDKYHFGTCIGLSPEAPVPLFKLEYSEVKPGMAANVEKNLLSFGNKVKLVTNPLEKITKERFIEARTKQQLLRMDTGESHPLSPLPKADLDIDGYDCVVISDYNKGTLPFEMCKYIGLQCAEKNIPLFVDSKKHDLSCFEDAIIKINEKESNAVLKRPSKCDMIITLGESGARWGQLWIQSTKTEVFDVCGAGDTFFAALVEEYMNSRAIQFANLCAAITVSKIGSYFLTPQEVEQIRKKHDA